MEFTAFNKTANFSQMNEHPLIGMGATYQIGSDSFPCTIYHVSNSGKTLYLREDNSERTDSNGMSELQEYKYSDDPNGMEYRATLRKDGRYRISKNNWPVSVGVRRRYYDYSF